MQLNYNDFGARYYDADVGRFLAVDRFADKYPSLTPYQYAANNPVFFVDSNGDSLINVKVNDYTKNIHGITKIIIDHRFLKTFSAIVKFAALKGIPIHINSSFRTLKQQNGDGIQKSGTTPAKNGSRHTAGLAIDFNFYKNNNYSNGVLYHNYGQTSINNPFIKAIYNFGERFGGHFLKPDPIHFDAGTNQDIQLKYGTSFFQIMFFP